MTETARPARAGRRNFLLLAALFALPMVAATILYASGWRPQGVSNHGDLVQPPRPLTDVQLQSWSGETLPFSRLAQKWTLVYFASSECGTDCERALYTMRQVQLAQAKEQGRVQRVLVVTDGAAHPWLDYVLKEYPDMTVLTGPADKVQALAGQFRAAVPDWAGRIFVVDPIGNLMMSYPANADPSGMRKDLKHLLKVSQVG